MTPHATAGKPLRQRRADQTRAEIVSTGMELFLRHGYDNTSMEQVALAAGVSRRTLYRYFASKDDIVFELPRLWLTHLHEAVANRRPNESTRDLFRRAIGVMAGAMEGDADRVLAGVSLLASSETLRARRGRSDEEWVQEYLRILLPDVMDDPDGPRQALVCAMTLVAAQNAMLLSWAANRASQTVDEVVHATLDQVDSVWPAGCR